jgi:hypothetical protein
MEAADEADLARASKQGTILHIKVNGTHYGTGGYESFYLGPEVVAERAAAFLAIVISCLVFMYLIRRYCMFKCEKSPRREVVRDGYKAHTDDAAAPKKNSLSNKLEALACTCDVGPISTEIRVLLQKPPMHRE